MNNQAEIITRHLPEHGECMVGTWRCICGQEGIAPNDLENSAQYAAHLLSKIAEAGYAVVKLPPEYEDGNYGSVSIEGTGIYCERNYLSGAGDARIVAAMLLRAAAQWEAKS